VPFAWTPILLACFSLARRTVREPLRLFALTALLTVVVDLTLDPGAVSQGFWTFDAPGAYYGVPLSNFVGWLLSGAIGAAILQGFVGRDGAPPVGWMTSAWLILVFWSSVCAWSGLWIAAIVGLISLAVLSKFLFFHATAEDPASSGA
jgi:putative membrane protein